MTTTVSVDLTMKELHRYFEKYQIANPALEDADDIISAAIAERWPGADPNEVLRQAEINWLAEDRKDIVRDANRDMAKWVDTTVQGDLFDNYPVRVPCWFMIDGEPREYWKVSIADALSYLQVRESALRAEADALQQAADEKRTMADRAKQQVEQTAHLIHMAEEKGIDPHTVKYAKKD
jgi:hypothetical protein